MQIIIFNLVKDIIKDMGKKIMNTLLFITLYLVFNFFKESVFYNNSSFIERNGWKYAGGAYFSDWMSFDSGKYYSLDWPKIYFDDAYMKKKAYIMRCTGSRLFILMIYLDHEEMGEYCRK